MAKSKGLENLQVLLDTVDETANEAMVSTALKIHELLRSSPPVGTPVDTGWASSNWTLSVDKPNQDVLGSKQNIISVSPGIAEVLQFDINKNRAIFIQNNVPYIARLNSGWSKQSPAGFVESAIDAAVSQLMVRRL